MVSGPVVCVVRRVVGVVRVVVGVVRGVVRAVVSAVVRGVVRAVVTAGMVVSWVAVAVMVDLLHDEHAHVWVESESCLQCAGERHAKNIGANGHNDSVTILPNVSRISQIWQEPADVPRRAEWWCIAGQAHRTRGWQPKERQREERATLYGERRADRSAIAKQVVSPGATCGSMHQSPSSRVFRPGMAGGEDVQKCSKERYAALERG